MTGLKKKERLTMRTQVQQASSAHQHCVWMDALACVCAYILAITVC